MKKIFLSHKSEDKPFVNKVAKALGGFCVIDSKSFEEGMDTSSEIEHFLKEHTSLFVVFISEKALQSQWVQKEINLSFDLLNSSVIQKIYPLIIDSSIDHNSPGIPPWMKAMNLKHVLNPSKASMLIKSRFRELIWLQQPKIKQTQQIFKGRNEQLKQFEERMDDFSLNHPCIVSASGLPKIGRKTFLYHALQKTSISSRLYFDYPVVHLESSDSIEDFLLSLTDLYDDSSEYLKGLSEKSMNEKVEDLVSLIKKLIEINFLIFIEDSGAIIQANGHYADWFKAFLKKVIELDLHTVVVCVVSKFRLHLSDPALNAVIFNVNVPELKTSERAGLLKMLLDVNEISVDEKRDFEKITGILNGSPDQVHYCAQYIVQNGTQTTLENLEQIQNYQIHIQNEIIENFQSKSEKKVLSLLTKFNFVSVELIQSITSINAEDLNRIVKKLNAYSAVEFVGSGKEYIRLNDTIKNMLERNAQYTLDSHDYSILKSKAKELISTGQFEDLSGFLVGLKTAIDQNYTIPVQYLIPSQYIYCMRTQYDKNKHQNVIDIADTVLVHSSKFDSGVIRTIKYWLCLALIKRGRAHNISRFFNDLEFFKEGDPDREFLLGFYYRHNDNFESAEKHFRNAMYKRKDFPRARRELVWVLMKQKKFDKALGLAEQNYKSDTYNSYHIYAYFDCLLNQSSIKKQDKELMEKLIARLKSNQHKQAQKFYLKSSIEYEKKFTPNSTSIRHLEKRYEALYGIRY